MTSPDKKVPGGSYGIDTTGASSVTSLTDSRQALNGASSATVKNYTSATFQAMTGNAVQNVMNNANTQAGNFVGAAIDEMLANLLRALAGTDILGIEPLAGLNVWANQLDQSASRAVNTSNLANGNANTALQSVQAIEAKASTGGPMVNVTSFPANLSNGTLGTGWNVGGDSGTGNAPWATDSSGNAYLQAQPATTAPQYSRQYALNTTTMGTDDHHAAATAAQMNSVSSGFTAVVVRAAADLSSFVYFLIFPIGNCYMGAGTYTPAAGSTPAMWAFNDFKDVNNNSITATITMAPGASVELSAVGNTYVGSVNGQQVLTYTDTTSLVTKGTGNRSVGVISEQSVDTQQRVWTGWAVSSFSAIDSGVVQTLGTGWSLYRDATQPFPTYSNPNNLSTVQLVALSGVFNQRHQTESNVTVVDPGAGKIQILNAGWYSVTFTCCFVNSLPNAAAAGFIVTLPGASPVSVRVGPIKNGGDVSCSASNVIYLQAGAIIQPGILPDGTGSAQIQGFGPGNLTYFEGALVSP